MQKPPTDNPNQVAGNTSNNGTGNTGSTNNTNGTNNTSGTNDPNAPNEPPQVNAAVLQRPSDRPVTPSGFGQSPACTRPPAGATGKHRRFPHHAAAAAGARRPSADHSATRDRKSAGRTSSHHAGARWSSGRSAKPGTGRPNSDKFRANSQDNPASFERHRVRCPVPRAGPRRTAGRDPRRAAWIPNRSERATGAEPAPGQGTPGQPQGIPGQPQGMPGQPFTPQPPTSGPVQGSPSAALNAINQLLTTPRQMTRQPRHPPAPIRSARSPASPVRTRVPASRCTRTNRSMSYGSSFSAPPRAWCPAEEPLQPAYPRTGQGQGGQGQPGGPGIGAPQHVRA